MYDCCECGQTVTQGQANIVWKMKTGKEYYLNGTSVNAMWQGRFEFSPLTETAFNQEQNLSENSVKCNSCN